MFTYLFPRDLLNTRILRDILMGVSDGCQRDRRDSYKVSTNTGDYEVQYSKSIDAWTLSALDKQAQFYIGLRPLPFASEKKIVDHLDILSGRKRDRQLVPEAALPAVFVHDLSSDELVTKYGRLRPGLEIVAPAGSCLSYANIGDLSDDQIEALIDDVAGQVTSDHRFPSKMVLSFSQDDCEWGARSLEDLDNATAEDFFDKNIQDLDVEVGFVPMSSETPAPPSQDADQQEPSLFDGHVTNLGEQDVEVEGLNKLSEQQMKSFANTLLDTPQDVSKDRYAEIMSQVSILFANPLPVSRPSPAYFDDIHDDTFQLGLQVVRYNSIGVWMLTWSQHNTVLYPISDKAVSLRGSSEPVNFELRDSAFSYMRDLSAVAKKAVSAS